MSIGNFNETSESSSDVNEGSDVNENKESNLDNTDSPRNQILKTPEDYSDNFDSKCAEGDKDQDVNEGDEAGEDPEKSGDDFDKKVDGGDEGSENTEDKGEGAEKSSPWDRFKKSLKPENFESHMDGPPEDTDNNETSETDEDPHEPPERERERSIYDEER